MNHAAPPYAPHQPVRPESNGLGIAAFVVSLIGFLFSGGLLSPVGLIMGLIAMRREPRGFAIAAVVIGLLGSCGIIALIIFGGIFGLAAIAAVIGLAQFQQEIDLTNDMVRLAHGVAVYQGDQGELPPGLEALDGLDGYLVDPWGTPYEYRRTEVDPYFDIVSAGEDGLFNSADDLALSSIGDDVWNVQGGTFKVDSSENGGTVRITAGAIKITMTGDEVGGGRILITQDDEVLFEASGDDEGGTFEFGGGRFSGSSNSGTWGDGNPDGMAEDVAVPAPDAPESPDAPAPAPAGG